MLQTSTQYKSSVSIICPLHNKADYIDELIKSVHAQTITDWELLVVENGSSDGGPQIVQNHIDSRVKLIEAPDSISGPGAARNMGLSYAVNDWILFLDADDWIEPEHLSNLLNVANRENADIAVTGWKEFREDEPQNYVTKSPIGRGCTRIRLPDHAIAFAPWAIHCALIHRDCLRSHLYWPEPLDRFASEDTVFWFKLVSEYTVAYAVQNSAVYRTHTPNHRNRFDDMTKWSDAMNMVTTTNLEYLKSNEIQPNAKQCENLMRLWADVAERSWRSQESSTTRQAVKRAQGWLNACKERGGVRTLPMRLRLWLGIKNFIYLKLLLSYL